MIDHRLLLPLFAAGVFITSCTTTEILEPTLQPTDPYYTSAFPIHNISPELVKIQSSVIRIASTGGFTTYFLDENNLLTVDQLDTLNLEDVSVRTENFEETTAGTAVVIGKSQNRAVLLTNAHTITFPDTLVTYRRGDDIPRETYVAYVTVKKRQTNIALVEPSLVFFNILDSNERADLALIDFNLRNVDDNNIRPVDISLGNSKNLQTGTVVYVLGFPKGFPMVTQGIVSDPNRRRDGSFLTDALFNRGVSGGLIIASKDNFRSFDWVGIANAGVATQEYFLIPDADFLDTRETVQAYQGPLRAEQKARMDYGITYAIPTEVIAEFLNRNNSRFRLLNREDNAGYGNNEFPH
ncbi:MAG: serine protease [Balneolaceae bacterium]